MISVSRFILPLALIVALLPTVSYADKYAPPGLYDVEYLTLNNDFGVVLKHRQHAHNVAIRLVVDVGHRHFPCKKRETAHFLEHLLFTGTSKHTETELERLIEDHGGTWNAVTSQS
ncbi:MAG: insulinase family protein, partial [Acidiferrobacterales bacterium]